MHSTFLLILVYNRMVWFFDFMVMHYDCLLLSAVPILVFSSFSVICINFKFGHGSQLLCITSCPQKGSALKTNIIFVMLEF